MRDVLIAGLSLVTSAVAPLNGRADLAPALEDDLREVEIENDLEIGASYLWLPGISIGGGFGRASVPYAPPFKSNYDLNFRYNSARVSVLSFDLRSPFLDDVLISFGFANYYPAAGREFDAQVLSLLNLESEFALRKKVGLSQALDLQASLAGYLRYERVSYPKGNFGMQGYPIQLGVQATRSLDLFELPQAIRAEFVSEFLQGGQTAVKFNYGGNNESENGHKMTFTANQRVEGQGHRAALTYAFAQRPGLYSGAGSDFQHHISVHWAQRSRNIKGFFTESSADGAVLSQRDGELDSTEWGLTWSERF